MSLSNAVCGKTETEDASKEKPTPEVTLEGVDTGPLTTREKKEWGTYVSEFLSPCPNVPVSIAQCVQEKRDCKKCGPAAKFVLREVKDGMTREQIEKSYKGRFEAEGVKTVPLDGSPVKGAENAAVTIVEFADFECPHCGEFAPVLDKLAESHKNDVRFSYKFYPLPGHPHADIAARAAIAAWQQNKFWEMHHALFTNQRALEQSNLEDYAKQLGLDVGRFRADMQAQATTDRIAKDRKLGEDLKIQGTPAVFINGRQYDGHQELNEWVMMDLGGPSTATPAPSLLPSSSSAPMAKPDAGK